MLAIPTSVILRASRRRFPPCSVISVSCSCCAFVSFAIAFARSRFFARCIISSEMILMVLSPYAFTMFLSASCTCSDMLDASRIAVPAASPMAMANSLMGSVHCCNFWILSLIFAMICSCIAIAASSAAFSFSRISSLSVDTCFISSSSCLACSIRSMDAAISGSLSSVVKPAIEPNVVPWSSPANFCCRDMSPSSCWASLNA